MAKGSPNRGNAYGTPSSLTSLLSPAQITVRPATAYTVTPFIQQQIQAEVDYVRQQSDRRGFHPLGGIRGPGATKSAFGRLIVHPIRDARVTVVGRDVPPAVKFAVPQKVAICVRRKVRREVLHALRRTNRAGASGRPRRRNAFTGVRC